eukprot:Clim_evm16s23 gene=Clim_evmTU16s23
MADVSIDKVKGFKNPYGASNCFLNCVVQVLYRLDEFRWAFSASNVGVNCPCRRAQNGTTDLDLPGCVACALRFLFAEYRYGKDKVVSTDLLRVALSLNYKNEKKFQIDEMDDALEAYGAIMDRLHEDQMRQLGRTGECQVGADDACVAHRKACLALEYEAHCEGCNYVKKVSEIDTFSYLISSLQMIPDGPAPTTNGTNGIDAADKRRERSVSPKPDNARRKHRDIRSKLKYQFKKVDKAFEEAGNTISDAFTLRDSRSSKPSPKDPKKSSLSSSPSSTPPRVDSQNSSGSEQPGPRQSASGIRMVRHPKTVESDPPKRPSLGRRESIKISRLDLDANVSPFVKAIRGTVDYVAGGKCPNGHDAEVVIALTHVPIILALGIAWDYNPSPADKRAVANAIETTLNVTEAFSGTERRAETTRVLRGLILYYGMHYISVAFDTKRLVWYAFDDDRVVKIGRYFDDVRKYIIRNGYQPSVLFYSTDVLRPGYKRELPPQISDLSLQSVQDKKLMMRKANELIKKEGRYR